MSLAKDHIQHGELTEKVPTGLTVRLSHKNINDIKFSSPQNFNTILFDSNLNCNLHCLYCHNSRDLGLVKEEDFINFIDTQVSSTDMFQIGCAMEPTMDRRMLKFIEIISKSKAKPKNLFRIQTNGILLKEKDIQKAEQYGVNRLTVSIDTLDPQVHKYLRGGSDIKKIIENIKMVRKKVPSLKTWFITTVHSENINSLDDLINFAVELGISGIEFRKMIYYSDSKIIQNHDDMRSLLLQNEKFVHKMSGIKDRWQKRIELFTNDEDLINFYKSREIT